MRQFVALAVVVLVAAAAAHPGVAQTVVAGTVVDSSSGKPVPRATVRVGGTYAGTAADEEGRFALRMPAGTARLRIGAVGYAAVVRTVPTDRDSVTMTVHLSPRAVPLGHVTVTARRSGPQSPSRFTLRPASVTQAPALGEPDLIRAAAHLPGISQPNDIDARLNVRGGSSDQNQFLLDGIQVYNPSHLFGLFGAFNPYATGNTTIHAASFPARHGGRLSSVINVRTRVPADSAYTRANLSLTSLSGAYAKEWGDTGVLAGLRRTYLDPVLAATGGPEGGSLGYNFLDANVKVNHTLTDRVTVVGIGYFQRDDLSVKGGDSPFEEASGTSGTDNTFTTWGNALGGLRLRVRQGALRHTVTGSVVHSFTDVDVSEVTLNNVLWDWTGRYEGSLTRARTRVRFGGQWKRRTFDYGWTGTSPEALASVLYGGLGIEEPQFGLPTTWATRTTRHLLSGYASVERRLLAGRLTLRGGLRVDGLYGGAAVWQPRLRATMEVSSGLRLHASAGRYAQFVATGYEGQEFNVTEPLLPLDRPTTAWTYTTGVTADLGETYRVRATAYARTMDHFPRLRKGVSPNAAGLPFRYGTLRAYGLDLLFEKSQGWITGQLAYSFGHVRTEFGGKRVPPSWSLPHTLEATFGLRMGQWRVQASGTLHSGLPYTPAVGRISGTDQVTGGLTDRYLRGARNSERLPLYARMDLALRRTYHAEWFDWTLYVQALNVLNRRNVLRITPSELYTAGLGQTRGEQAGVQRSLPIVPTVGVEFNF
ncbi:MAG: carboxypeptidase-like regulatory domain-containing protein [Salinibacter sp.]